MNKLRTFLLLGTSIALLFAACSKKNSEEACIHEVTMNLDKGNYDAVIASGCASAMQKGAAYFSLAGFDVKEVINVFSQTGVSSSATTTQNDLYVYMTSLVNNATGTSLQYMNDALTSYETVSTTTGYTMDNYKDAQFCVSLVNAVKSLSLLESVVPNLLDANGNLNSACDYNNNSVPDAADASSCSLIAASRISEGATVTCTDATYSPAVPVDITLKDSRGQAVAGTYSGLDITITQVPGGSATACIPPNTTTYKKLLYKDTATGKYWVATTSDESCTDANNSSSVWPCPILQDGQPLDLVSAIDESLDSAINSLGIALPGMTSSDIQTAITDMRAQACCGCTTTPCAACTSACTSQSLAAYLLTL